MGEESKLVLTTIVKNIGFTELVFGEKTLLTEGTDVRMTFICRYDMTVTLTADDFEVTKVSLSGTESADGNLEKGFTMTTDIVDGKTVLGNIMTVSVTWSVTGLADVKFYYQSCTVTHGTTAIEII